MIFKWRIDGGDEVIKGGPLTSTTLTPGEHFLVLEVQDSFGYVSRDTMRVTVR